MRKKQDKLTLVHNVYIDTHMFIEDIHADTEHYLLFTLTQIITYLVVPKQKKYVESVDEEEEVRKSAYDIRLDSCNTWKHMHSLANQQTNKY